MSRFGLGGRAAGSLLSALVASGCQTFVDVDVSGRQPVFSWRTDAPVTGLLVVAGEDCSGVHGKELADRVWWQLSGPLKPPVTYGVVPPGVSELAAARPFPRHCGAYTVTLTDPSFRGESATFRP